MVRQEIDNSGEILSTDIKEKMKKALTTFIKSGKGIEISIKSKDKDGISEDELYELVKDCIDHIEMNRENSVGDWVNKFDWKLMAPIYDKLFRSYI